MSLLSAYTDFVATTLDALPGLWARLAYVAGLRSRDTYGHWGMERAHGEAESQAAMARAHTELLLRLLRTGTAQLLSEAEAERAGSAAKLEGYFRNLLDRREGLLPAAAGRATRAHFTAVLTALALVSEARASHPAA